MKRPLVSVIVAAYNIEAYLGECLDSILAQTYDNFELIIVDDASTDNTSFIIETYKLKDSRIRAVRLQKNSGPSAVRNKGMDLAIGKYISFVDGDDLIAKTLLSDTVNYAEKHELDEVLFGYRTFSIEQGLKWTEQSTTANSKKSVDVLNGKAIIVMKEQMRKNENNHKIPVTSWAWFYNRRFLKKNNIRFLENVLHEDILFWFQCQIYAKRVMILDKELYFYRSNTRSITKGWRDTRAKSLFAVIVAVYVEWIKNNFSKEENDAIAAFITRQISHYKVAVLRGETKDININPALDFGYKFLCNYVPYMFGNLPPNTAERLRNVDNVFIYGAGAAAADVFDQLEKLYIKPTGVMVSYKNGNTETFGNAPIKTLAEWGFVDNAAIIIAVTKMYREGIENKLREYGYTQIINVEEN